MFLAVLYVRLLREVERVDGCQLAESPAVCVSSRAVFVTASKLELISVLATFVVLLHAWWCMGTAIVCKYCIISNESCEMCTSYLPLQEKWSANPTFYQCPYKVTQCYWVVSPQECRSVLHNAEAALPVRAWTANLLHHRLMHFHYTTVVSMAWM